MDWIRRGCSSDVRGSGQMSRQSIATRKYEAAKGIISKSFTLPRSLVDEYKQACERAGVSMTGQLKKMMTDFIAQHPAPEEPEQEN